MARSFGASAQDTFLEVYFWAFLSETLGGLRIGVIRVTKGVIICQLLISIICFGPLFKL
jgi:ABC-type nitrate/sulfonate/bicarbonate transport system permease component